MVVTVGVETAILFFGVPCTRLASLVTTAFAEVLLWIAGPSVATLVGGPLSHKVWDGWEWPWWLWPSFSGVAGQASSDVV